MKSKNRFLKLITRFFDIYSVCDEARFMCDEIHSTCDEIRYRRDKKNHMYGFFINLAENKRFLYNK
jgi:hypothetical protein